MPCRVHAYREDWGLVHSTGPPGVISASQLASEGTPHGQEAAAAKQLWRDVASAAESGWDFSTRWLIPSLTPHTPDAAGSTGSGNEEQQQQAAAGTGAADRRADLRQLRTTQVRSIHAC